MPERPNPSVQLPGYSVPWGIPGQAKKLAARAQAGRGELAAEQAEANKLFRTREADEYTAPLPRRVESIDDVTAGLGLDRATEARVQKMIEEQRVDFQKKGQTQRVFLAANALTESLRRIRDVPSDARMEITKRARAFWRNTQPTDYAKEPTVRAPQRTQMRSNTSITTKSGVCFIIRDPLAKSAKKPKAPPTGMYTTPPIAQGAAPPAPGGAPAVGPVSTTQPPAGFSPIPHSSKGGFRKKGPEGWIYWYPGAGITSTAHPDDAGGVRNKRAAEGSPTMAGAPAGPTPGGAAQPQGGQPTPKQATDKPHVQKDANGEKRVFHPDVHAHVPAGKENDHKYHAAEFQRHRAEKAKAMRTGDAEKAKAHTYAMNFHADKHNRLLAQMQGKKYKPKKSYPGVDESAEDDGSSVIASQYERAGTVGKDGRQSSAADPRERFVPESESVKGMREKIGKAVNIMADLSQAHDHLSSLKAKRLEAKRSGHPLARRMIAQIDAEIAATKHDIVQLEDAHQHAMKEVVAHQALLRNERIRANPIFQAFMAAMAKLSTLGESIGASLGEKAGAALEGVKGAIDDFKNRGAREAQAKQRGQFEGAMSSAVASDADPESGEVKPLGVSKDDIAAKFGDPEADAAAKQRDAEAMETLKKLGAMQGDPDDLDDMREGGGSEVDAALADIFDMHSQKEQGAAKQAAAQQQKQAESAAFDADLAGMRAKRDKAVATASAQADAWEKRNAKRNPKSVMREALGGGDDAATRPTDPGEEKGTMASGVRRKKSAKIAVEKSMRLVKSEEWREVMRLAPKLDATLRKSVPVHYVAPLRHVARAPMTFLDLYGG